MTSPVTLALFQTYLRDASVDPTITAFFQRLLETATERVYTWLDRDYTASAVKTDVFWGNDERGFYARHPVGTLLSWIRVDGEGNTTSLDISDLMLRENRRLVITKTLAFESGYEHRVSYELPASLTCPETVQQVILEIATLLYDSSKQGSSALGVLVDTDRNSAGTARERYVDLTERHKELLRPYKRVAV